MLVWMWQRQSGSLAFQHNGLRRCMDLVCSVLTDLDVICQRCLLSYSVVVPMDALMPPCLASEHIYLLWFHAKV